ncbi:cytochrome P450 71D9-like [Neltuma alba]|uniref:cytochrome P450 71D9-like n=1 Tax=Neltuma alba TaxID=207710 RepID=UPI0010A45136|nr:cytochrome P450 71D9-like [Prosopis alba]
MHQLIGSLPHRSLANLANKYGPFMHLKLGQVSHIIVSSPEYAKEIMKNHDQIFANRPRILASDIFAYDSTDIIFSPYGNYWRQLRKIGTSEIFSAKRVQSFRRIREEEVSELVRNIAEHEGSFMNLSRKISTLTNSVVARTAFGTKTKNVDQMLQIMEQSIKLSSGLSISDLYPSLKFISVITGTRARIMKVHKDGDKVFDDIIRDHREKKRNNDGDTYRGKHEGSFMNLSRKISRSRFRSCENGLWDKDKERRPDAANYGAIDKAKLWVINF